MIGGGSNDRRPLVSGRIVIGIANHGRRAAVDIGGIVVAVAVDSGGSGGRGGGGCGSYGEVGACVCVCVGVGVGTRVVPEEGAVEEEEWATIRTLPPTFQWLV